MGFLSDNKIKAVCFDIDGTLYPKYETHIYLLKAAIAHPIFSYRYNKMRGEIRRMDKINPVPATSLAEFRKRESRLIYGKEIEDYERRYRSFMYEPWCRYDKKLTRFDNLIELLDKLKANGYMIGFLSDFPLGNKLEVLGVESYASFASSTEDYGTLKPNGTPFFKMAEAMGVEPKEILYVGDSYSKDVVGSKNAGLSSVMNTNKKGSYPLADIVIKNYMELMERLF